MIKEAIGTGLSIEEAYEQAKNNLISKLGNIKFNDDDIQFDVLTTPKKKTLGFFGGSEAEVKAYIEFPDAVKPKKEKAPKQKVAKEIKPLAEKPVAEKETAVKTDVAEETVDYTELQKSTPASNAVEYLQKILTGLGCENIDIKVALKDNSASFYLSGDGLGVVIGRRGETLGALQYLASLAANSAKGYYKITLNIGDFRERREKTLISLATRVSAQVLRTGRSRLLEPMNPYERRIIHTAVQDIKGVSSNSTGEGSSRRVVISLDNDSKRGGNNRGDKKPVSNTDTVSREPKRDIELPLYGKIN